MNALTDPLGFEAHKAAYRTHFMPADLLKSCYDVAPDCVPSDEVQAYAKRAVARVVKITGVNSTEWKMDLKQAAWLIFRALVTGSDKTPPIAQAQMDYYKFRKPALEAV